MNVDDEASTATRGADRAKPGPVLSRGRHPDAEPGVCLMEFTALLAGEDLTDRPICVHPLVAAVARVVNDAVSDEVRDELLALGPALPGTTTDVPEIADRITLTVIEAALPVALPIWAPRLRRERRRILRRLGHGESPSTPHRMRSEERTVTFAAASLAVARTEDPDGELIRLLDEVLAVAGGAARGGRAGDAVKDSPHPDQQRAAGSGRRHVLAGPAHRRWSHRPHRADQ